MRLRLLWLRPSRSIGATASTSTLLIGCRPERSAAPGCDLHLLVDTSGSMGSAGKLQGAKEACRAVLAGLRAEDACAISAFSGAVTPILPLTPRTALDLPHVHAHIDALAAGGITRMDQAIDQARTALRARTDSARPATLILITDGHPTDPKGARLADTDDLESMTTACGEQGFSVVAIGVGSANDFDGDLLERLADKGRGAFCHASRGGALSSLLQDRLSRSQSMVCSNAEIRLRPLACSAQVRGLCRMTPEYVNIPLLGAGPDGAIALPIGALPADAETVCLASIETEGQFGLSGPQPVLTVNVNAGGGERAEDTAILDFTSDLRAQQVVEPEVRHFSDRWELVRLNERARQSTDPHMTGQLLEQIRDTASALGDVEAARSAAERLEELKSTGQISADSNVRATVQIRSTPAAYATGEVRPPGRTAPAASGDKPALSRVSARLVVRAGASLPMAYSIDRSPVTLGRGPANDVDLSSQEPDGVAPRVSRRHARIVWEGDACWLEDLGSTNGTEADSVPLAAKAEVRKGTVIRLGGSVELEAQCD